MRVLTLGTFDLFHAGHLRLLQRAAAYGQLIVGVNTDRFAASYKRLPVIPENDRLNIVAALRFVHQAELNDGPGYELVEQWKPNVIAVGSDWHQRDYPAQIGVGANEVALLYLPYTDGVSTTRILEAAWQHSQRSSPATPTNKACAPSSGTCSTKPAPRINYWSSPAA